MNRYQRILVAVAFVNALIMVLYPPFNSLSLSKFAGASFDGFYPVYSQFGKKLIDADLLMLELMLLATDVLAAWLMLQGRNDENIARRRYSQGIAIVAAINIGVMLLFPPFETYSSTLRYAGSSFDSFYFAFGTRSSRPIFAPLLYLELIFVVVNALLLWLLFHAVEAPEDALQTRIATVAGALDRSELAQLSADMRGKADAHRRANGGAIVDGKTEYRHPFDPADADRDRLEAMPR